MGKYRTCVNNGANASCSGGKSAKVVHRSLSSSHSSSHSENGNCGGKFQGNPINLAARRPSNRSSLVLVYALALGVSILFSLSQGLIATAQPVQGQTGFDLLQQLGQVEPEKIIRVGGPLPSGQDANATDPRPGGEALLAHPNCSRPSAEDFPGDLFSLEARRSGAILLHFLVTIYLFYALLLVCEEYFVPAVESICRELRIPSDVAGATFMAISTSAPELFTNVIGTFLTQGDMGVGTIVGSAVFNILAVGACCGIGAGYSVLKMAKEGDKLGVRLDWWPLTRDSFFYLVSVGALIGILSNRRVYWTEALLMLVLYALYVVVLCFNTPIKNGVEGTLHKLGAWWGRSGDEPGRISHVVGKIMLRNNERTPLLLSVNEKSQSVPDNNNMNLGQGQRDRNMSTGRESNNANANNGQLVDLVLSKEYHESLDQVLIYNALSASGSYASQPIEECSGCCKWPPSPSPDLKRSWNWRRWLGWVISWPIRLVLWFTIPDCRVYTLRHWYWGTLALCVAWIGVLTYLISWMVTIIGETLSIPDSVTGLTFLAAGTSIPEVISSLIVARQGLGSMGFSNTIGSNTFDVLVCLGLPWLIKGALLTSEEVDYVEIHSGGLEYSAVILVSALLLLYGAIALNGFILDARIGVGCVIVYAIFISFACMLEMNVFFPVNLPPC